MKDELDIDWLSVYRIVHEGHRVALKTREEKRMVVRRMQRRMIPNVREAHAARAAGQLSADEVGELMGMSGRNVQRIAESLPPAEKMVCPQCQHDMWVYPNGIVEPHAKSLIEECEYSGDCILPTLSGLAAIRPDLYQWVAS